MTTVSDGDSLRRWLEDLLARPVAVFSLSLALFLAGILLARRLPVEWSPSLELPTVSVTTAWPGASARAVEREITLQVERAVQRVPWIAALESVSEPGSSVVRVEVASLDKLDLTVAEIGEQVARLRPILPPWVVPRVDREAPASDRQRTGFMRLQLVGGVSAVALRRLADERIAPPLLNLPGVSRVRVEGGEELELGIDLDADRLNTHGLAAETVSRVLRRAFEERSFGTWRREGRVTLLQGRAMEQADEVGELVVALQGETPVRVHDLGRVRLRPAAAVSRSRVNGQPVVSLQVDRAAGSHLLETARSVRRKAEELVDTLPDRTVALSVVEDQSEDLRAELTDLKWRGAASLVLVIAALFVMLRSRGAVLSVLLAAALSLALALGMLGVIGLTLNLVTLAGLVVIFGLLVDNAVVVVEQFQRRLRSRTGGLGARQLASALRAVALPLVAGTLSTIALTAPLVLLSGDWRQVFWPLGLLLAAILLLSLPVAFLLLPVLGRWLHLVPSRRRRAWRLRRVSLLPYRLAARWPRLTLIAVVLFVGIPWWLLPHKIELPPSFGEAEVAGQRRAALYNRTLGHPAALRLRSHLEAGTGGLIRPLWRAMTRSGRGRSLPVPSTLVVRVRLPAGAGIDRADELIRQFEELALESSSVERSLVTVRDSSATQRSVWRSGALETAGPFRLRERMIDRATRVTGARVDIRGLTREGFTSGGGRDAVPFLLAASGPSFEDLEACLEDFSAQLLKHPRISHVELHADRVGRSLNRQVVALQPRWESMERWRIDTESLAEALRSRIATAMPSLYADFDRWQRLPVRISVGNREVPELDSLMATAVRNSDNLALPLKELTRPGIESRSAVIERTNQQYVRHLTVSFRGPLHLGSEVIDRQLATFRAPPTIQLRRTDLTSYQLTSPRLMLILLLVTTGVIFLVIAAACESWSLAALAVVTLPVALAGAGVAFSGPFALSFGEGAFIGLLLLLGISVNDHILMAARYRSLERRRPNLEPRRRVLLALSQRLRPMWTTTATTLAGLLPLLVAVGGDSGRFWQAMALTVTFGLLASTALGPLIPVAWFSWRRRSAG
ncbi:MAG: efflux RND transporter permease subunit [Acidobacteriota bacterium]